MRLEIQFQRGLKYNFNEAWNTVSSTYGIKLSCQVTWWFGNYFKRNDVHKIFAIHIKTFVKNGIGLMESLGSETLNYEKKSKSLGIFRFRNTNYVKKSKYFSLFIEKN